MDDIEFYPSAIKQHPEFAASIAYVIACGGFIDCTLASILTLLLHAEPRVGTAMYTALTSADGRRAALNAAAKEALTPDNFNRFEEALKKTDKARNRRNDFAHHLWGSSKQLPDALLLIPPRAFAAREVRLAEANREIIATGKPITPKLSLDGVQVYRKPDFEESERFSNEAVTELDMLRINVALSVGYNLDHGLVEVGRIHPGQLDELLAEVDFPDQSSGPKRLWPQSQRAKSPPENGR